jgi:hypothetical protein
VSDGLSVGIALAIGAPWILVLLWLIIEEKPRGEVDDEQERARRLADEATTQAVAPRDLR